jgi:hypothetical protein
MMKTYLAIMVLAALLAGCRQPATVSQDVVQTAAAKALTAIPTQTPSATLIPSDTPTITPSMTPSPSSTATATATATPTSTPIPTGTPTPIPTRAVVATKVVTVNLESLLASGNVDDRFYGGLVKCVGSTDIARLLVGNSPGEIVETYRREIFNVMTLEQCVDYFQTRATAIKQTHICVMELPEPTNGDLSEVRKSSILALADLAKIRQSDYSPGGLCSPLGRVNVDDGRVAYNNAQKHLQYAQSMLDKYRREHNR